MNPINESYSLLPFVGITRDAGRKVGDIVFRVFVYTAYNALGLIGPECNGLAVCNESAMDIVLDEHARANSGYFGPSREQLAEFERVCRLPDDEFLAFINGHRRSRYGFRRRDGELIPVAL